jgi:hypothetical protein
MFRTLLAEIAGILDGARHLDRRPGTLHKNPPKYVTRGASASLSP